MGLKISAVEFQCILNTVLGDFKGKIHLAFLDDGSITSDEAEYHLTELENIFGIMWQYGMMFKLSECKFGVKYVEILGHKVTTEGKPTPYGNVYSIRRFREAKNVTEVIIFMGLTNFFAIVIL